MEKSDFQSLDILEELQARLAAELEPLVRRALRQPERALLRCKLRRVSHRTLRCGLALAEAMPSGCGERVSCSAVAAHGIAPRATAQRVAHSARAGCARRHARRACTPAGLARLAPARPIGGLAARKPAAAMLCVLRAPLPVAVRSLSSASPEAATASGRRAREPDLEKLPVVQRSRELDKASLLRRREAASHAATHTRASRRLCVSTACSACEPRRSLAAAPDLRIPQLPQTGGLHDAVGTRVRAPQGATRRVHRGAGRGGAGTFAATRVVSVHAHTCSRSQAQLDANPSSTRLLQRVAGVGPYLNLFLNRPLVYRLTMRCVRKAHSACERI
jgi:hypothetical protein